MSLWLITGPAEHVADKVSLLVISAVRRKMAALWSRTFLTDFDNRNEQKDGRLTWSTLVADTDKSHKDNKTVALQHSPIWGLQNSLKVQSLIYPCRIYVRRHMDMSMRRSSFRRIDEACTGMHAVYVLGFSVKCI